MYSPKFVISNKILRNIGVIEAAKEIIDHAPLLPYYEKQFRQDALVRTVHHGTHIEGNELNLNQAEKILAGQDVVARERDIKEVINYRKAMEYISEFKILNLKFKMTEGVLQDIHKITVDKILPSDKCGEFRKTQVVVKNSSTGQVSFRPPIAIAVPVQIKELMAFINNLEQQDIHPVLRSGIVHYELVRIHPFIDGNGRVARALSTLILFLEGYDIRKFFSLEEYFDSDSGRYYEALQSVAKNAGDLTKWLEYFTEGLAIELAKIKEKVEKISIDVKLKEKLGGKPIMLTERQLKIIEYIQKTGYLQNQAFEQLFPMVSEDTILNELKVLLQNGIIRKQGVTKGAKYIMSK
ncbi:MAG: Fic family protein [Candidatus Levybacteria bacterium]|nr:Fic family protein [Candidatus Levybacteria bacterium]